MAGCPTPAHAERMAVKIQFAQGVNVGNVGEALVGSAGASVVASDGNASPGAVSHYRWTWIDVPTLSTIPLGFITEGPVSSISFEPDVAGDYHLLVEAFSTTGFKTVDRRVFRVELPSTRALPAFDAEADALNFLGQTRGWKPDMEAWLLYVESLVTPGHSSVGPQGAMQVAGAVAGTFATATNLFAGQVGMVPYIAWAATANVASSGLVRFPFVANGPLIYGRSALGVDAPILGQLGQELKLGFEDNWRVDVYGRRVRIWAKHEGLSMFAGTSGTGILFANERGFNIGGTNDIVDGTKVLAISAGTPPVTPTSSAQIYYDTATGALRYLRPNGEHVTLADFPTVYDPSINGLRLTAVTNQPIPLTDTSNATTIYLTPYRSGTICLRTGTRWILRTTSQATLVLSGMTAGFNYDVFAYWNGAAVTLELSAAWANNTTRTDAIARVDGVWVKNSDNTRRYVGTIRATAAGQTQDTVLQRYVWNVDNQIDKFLWVEELTESWGINLAAGTWRQVRSTATNRVEVVVGLPTPMNGYAQMLQSGLPAGMGVAAWTGFGVDSTTVNIGFAMAHLNDREAQFQWNVGYSVCDTVLDIGYHAVNWLESGHTSGGGVTAYGTTGQSRTHMRIRLSG